MLKLGGWTLYDSEPRIFWRPVEALSPYRSGISAMKREADQKSMDWISDPHFRVILWTIRFDLLKCLWPSGRRSVRVRRQKVSIKLKLQSRLDWNGQIGRMARSSLLPCLPLFAHTSLPLELFNCLVFTIANKQGDKPLFFFGGGSLWSIAFIVQIKAQLAVNFQSTCSH